eukprot:CAMPEP_0172761430 /NCGR_PEP_ID=MMETSP1074-20121228/171531_1 /TAXON_ID=2916 /ORGANISM="Ceratium fusus, Strain PA161109" /LENGTH=64 /DNA_ID=CAMNT_0013595617 /DNA_START=798 /DNA_END=992 /DNA_ORIENTATION=-
MTSDGNASAKPDEIGAHTPCDRISPLWHELKALRNTDVRRMAAKSWSSSTSPSAATWDSLYRRG